MVLNSFSVHIPEGRETHSGYVEMAHGRQYTLALRNFRDVACDAAVTIDGKPVGTFRLNAGQSLKLERPAHDQGCFTFYQVGTAEAQQAGLVAADTLGLISVVFTPALKPIYAVTYPQPTVWTVTGNTWRYTSDSTSSGPVAASFTSSVTNQPRIMSAVGALYDTAPQRKAGGTGLSGHSQQQFVDVGPMNLDYAQQTTIHLRLVGGSDQPRPLTANSNPVPPYLG